MRFGNLLSKGLAFVSMFLDKIFGFTTLRAASMQSKRGKAFELVLEQEPSSCFSASQ